MTPKLTTLLTVSACLLAGAPPVPAQDGAAPAAPLTLELEGEAERTRVDYACRDDEDRSVEYINLPGNTLAILPVEGRATVFVSVLAASGAKYASGPWVWWTKGARADFYDERAGDPSRNIVCRVKRG